MKRGYGIAVTWECLLEAGLLLVLPLVFYRPLTEQFSTPKIVLMEWLVVAGLAASVLAFFWRRGPSPRSPFAWPIALLAAAVLLSCMNSPAPGFSLDQTRHFLCGPAWLLILVLMGGGAATQTRLARFAAVAGTLVAIITCAQWTGYDPLLFGGFRIIRGSMVQRMYLYSTFGNPNFVAGYLVGVVFVVFSLAIVAQNLAAKLAWLGCSLAILLAIGLTQSHGAWGALIVGWLIWLWLRRSRPALNPEPSRPSASPPVGTGLSSLKSLVFLPPVVIALTVPMFSNLPGRLMDQLAGRIYLWRLSWPMFAQHPLIGSGWKSFQLRFLELQAQFLARHPDQIGNWSNISQLHNDLLQIMLEAGALGMAAFLWLLWVYAKAMRAGLSNGDPRTRQLLSASAGGVAAILVDSCFNFQFAVPPTLILLFTLLAFPALLTAPEEQSLIQSSGLRSTGLRILGSVAALVCAAFLFVQTARFAGAELAYARGLRFELSGGAELSTAEQAYRDGLALNPRDGRIHFGLSRIQYRQQKFPAALAEASLAAQTYSDSHLEVLIGRIQESMGMRDAALATLQHALALDPTLKTVQSDIKRLEKNSGDN
jgi:O-antigen ligase